MVELTEFLQLKLFFLTRYFLLLLVAFLGTYFIFPMIVEFLKDIRLVKLNYRNETIPTGAGIIFLILLPIIIGIGLLLSVVSFNNTNSFLFLFVIMGMGVLGIIDDQSGNHEVKGFKGHLTALFFKRKLTTGGFKAVFGALIALVFSIGAAKFSQNGWLPWLVLINFLLVVLATNSINLFDLRPGRAGKVYLFAFIIILLFSRHFEDYIGIFLPIVVIILTYLPYDLKAQAMLGDVGSNLLGATLGMMMAWMLSDIGKVVALLCLVFLQVAAEKVSFTEIIKKNQVLRYLDDLGRGNE